jgi:TonB family protein
MVLLIVTASGGARAASPKRSADTGTFMPGYYPVEKLRAFMTRKRPCYFWLFATTIDTRFAPVRASGDRPLCVWKGVVEADTVNEESGCMIGFYDHENDEYLPYKVGQPPDMLPNVKCSPEAVLTLFRSTSLDDTVAGVVRMAGQNYEGHSLEFETGGTGPTAKILKLLRQDGCPSLSGAISTAFGCPVAPKAEAGKVFQFEDARGQSGFVPPEPTEELEPMELVRHYPHAAKAKELEGVVSMRLTIDAKGAVSKVVVPSRIGDGFDEAAESVVKGLRFKPGRLNGVPVIVEIPYSVEFSIPE